MNRIAYRHLIDWKSDPLRKPMLLIGARQTGKTYLLKQFGKTEYSNLVYCNFEEDPELRALFESSLAPEHLLKVLSLYLHTPIRPGDDLLFFDEIQSCNGALNSLKYFCEEAPSYHVAAAGSLLGVKLSKPLSFPVGKVSIRHLHPVTFPEYLDAVGRSDLREMLDSYTPGESVPEPIHKQLIDLLKQYYVVGGMPGAVSAFVQTGSYERTREIQTDILGAYERDFAKHASTADIPKLLAIWESLPSQLARENRKFVFTALSRTARAREYESALQWLGSAGLVLSARALSTVQQPLAGFVDHSAFKLYALDVGLLAAKARLGPEVILKGSDLFTTYHGMFVESYVAQQLSARWVEQTPLYYWRSESYGAEVDFVLDHAPELYPLEVKAGVNPRSRSLKSFDSRFHPPRLLRTTALNFDYQERITNIPLYAVHLIPRLLSGH